MSEKQKVFISRPDLPPSVILLLKDRFELDIWEEEKAVPREVLLKRISNKSGLIITSSYKVDSEFLDAAGPNLKVIATMSVGFDHIDVPEVKKRNVKLGYTPGVLDDAVAELTVALLLSMSRRLFEGRDAIAKGEWKEWVPWFWLNGVGLKNSVVGIVGLGRIGIEVARRLIPFKVKKILYVSRTPKKEADELNAVKVELSNLLSESDFVVVTCTLNEETENLLSDKEFARMKRTAVVVNTSRGKIIDQNALVRALKSNTIAGAALDVMSPEPLPKTHDLLSLPNCCKFIHQNIFAT